MLLRPLLVLVLAAAPAAGDPPGKPAPVKPPPLQPPVATVVPPEATAGDTWDVLPNVKRLHPGIGGGSSIGIVIDPGAHPDMQPYPRGMVIQPPSIDPGMLLDLDDRTTAVGRLYNGLRSSLDTLLQLVVPRTF